MVIKKALTVIIWQKPKAAAKILLLKRPKNKGNFWQPVTGHLEKNEDFVDAALREAKEETGLSFKHKAQYLGVHFTYDGRFGPTEEKAFVLFIESKIEPKVKIDASEHEKYEWCGLEEALVRITYPDVKEAVCRAANPVSPFVLKKTGQLFQDEEEITHGRTVDLLFRSVEERDGEFFVVVSDQEVKAIVEDAVYYVQSIDLKTGSLKLLGNIEKKLEADSVFVGKDNAFYCRLDGKLTKFLRSAHYELSKAVT